jgi:hypothetical protein
LIGLAEGVDALFIQTLLYRWFSPLTTTNLSSIMKLRDTTDNLGGILVL